MEIYKTLESLGFFEWLYDTHDLRDTDMKPEYLDRLSLDDIHRTAANSMAFRWFREKHNLFANIHSTRSWVNSYKIIYWDDSCDSTTIWDGEKNYKIREEAELACLVALIEIVKNK